MNQNIKGFTAGILAAIFYGTNPLGALPLYAHGLSSGNVLFYRYGMAALMFAVWLLFTGEGFKIKIGHAIKFATLGSFCGISSVLLFLSFLYMNAGVASTILFSYPIITAVLMVVFYHERITWATALSILLAIIGIGLLYRGEGGTTLSLTGILLVLGSSLLYALYIVYVKQFKITMSPVKYTFWITFFGWLTIVGYMVFVGDPLQILDETEEWLYSVQLALFPTLLSLYCMNVSINIIGSTASSILGALEPVTAVAISCLLFGESLTFRLASGIVLILSAVILIILKQKKAS